MLVSQWHTRFLKNILVAVSTAAANPAFFHLTVAKPFVYHRRNAKLERFVYDDDRSNFAGELDTKLKGIKSGTRRMKEPRQEKFSSQ